MDGELDEWVGIDDRWIDEWMGGWLDKLASR